MTGKPMPKDVKPSTNTMTDDTEKEHKEDDISTNQENVSGDPSDGSTDSRTSFSTSVEKKQE